ncbi:UMP kinase [Mucisphaera calidilacus]|uniref:Uridylate kinase n=1 Tax=Mucisphaera calidilacus TaxID=2527982 RepID=A0A518BZ74_9BACT|nr:UMP kinase [Mucisphaera calidilacus]QDU72269.1 Uridylate kinase [Mucisphaera calidilacus]
MSSTPDPSASEPRYRRVLLKLSGEALCRSGEFGIDAEELRLIGGEIVKAAKQGTQLAVVVGGGNMIRGAAMAKDGVIEQATADYMGMLGTVINALALKEVLEKLGQPARVLSAINLSSVAETFIRGRAIRHLEKGRVVIFAAGTGNPFFTTDSGAALRATEIGADVVLKATKVDGVYDKDPVKYPDAVRFERLSFDEAIDRRLAVMDLAAFTMCKDNGIPIVVFNMKTPGHIAEVVAGVGHGTLVEP